MDNLLSSDYELALWSLIARTRHTLLTTRQRELAANNITPGQAFIIDIVHRLGNEATVKAIATHAFRENHSISEQANRIEQKGLLKKIRDVPGSTVVRFELTEKGREAHELIKRRHSIHDIVSVLSAEEYQTMIECLTKLINKAHSM